MLNPFVMCGPKHLAVAHLNMYHDCTTMLTLVVGSQAETDQLVHQPTEPCLLSTRLQYVHCS